MQITHTDFLSEIVHLYVMTANQQSVKMSISRVTS